eukprot:5144058-Amphidinium_carterae.1
MLGAFLGSWCSSLFHPSGCADWLLDSGSEQSLRIQEIISPVVWQTGGRPRNLSESCSMLFRMTFSWPASRAFVLEKRVQYHHNSYGWSCIRALIYPIRRTTTPDNEQNATNSSGSATRLSILWLLWSRPKSNEELPILSQAHDHYECPQYLVPGDRVSKANSDIWIHWLYFGTNPLVPCGQIATVLYQGISCKLQACPQNVKSS